VFGLGHVGIVQAACLADEGRSVIGVDRDLGRLEAIADAVCPIGEPELPALLERVVESGRLRTSHSVDDAVRDSEVSIVCVNTPSAEDGAVDLDDLVECLDAIAAALASKRGNHALIIRSTVPVGTMQHHVLPRFEPAAAGHDLDVACLFIPEFMREGDAIRDYRRPHKIVVGCATRDRRSEELVRQLYGSAPAPVHFVSYEEAELAKYVDNCWHALKVCFANEVGALSSALGLDGQRLMQLFREDRLLNISDAYLKPGMPFGGSCLPKDLEALQHMAQQNALELPLLGSVMASNDRHLERCVAQVLATGARRIGVWGVSFKPATADLRNSPTLALVELLLAEGRTLALHDERLAPQDLARAVAGRNALYGRALEDGRIRIAGRGALDECDVLVLCHAPGEPAVGRPGQRLVRLHA
jgi:GDP-mannose 6-dehydrogenase